MKEQGVVIIVSGPAGVGKDTIINILTSTSDFAKFTTCTTRNPRPGEINGVHYNFMDEPEFISLWDSGKLLDHVVIAGNHYGLPLETLGQMAHMFMVAKDSKLQKRSCAMLQNFKAVLGLYGLPYYGRIYLEKVCSWLPNCTLIKENIR